MLDATFNVYLSQDSTARPIAETEEWWMGNLWNNCDWCDGSWSYENCPSLVDEAHRVVNMLSQLRNSGTV
jgi:hypothetical protein